MEKFTYVVGTHAFADDEAWGEGWKQAKKIATELHTGIFREVFDNRTEETYTEFYAKGGCFLHIRFYEDRKLKIF